VIKKGINRGRTRFNFPDSRGHYMRVHVGLDGFIARLGGDKVDRGPVLDDGIGHGQTSNELVDGVCGRVAGVGWGGGCDSDKFGHGCVGYGELRSVGDHNDSGGYVGHRHCSERCVGAGGSGSQVAFPCDLVVPGRQVNDWNALGRGLERGPRPFALERSILWLC